MEWWHWAVLGMALIVAELVVPAFVLIWFGVGALVVSALTWLVPTVGLSIQILVLVIAASVLIGLWFKVVKPNRHKTRAGMSDSDLIGQVAMLIEKVAPFKRGKVRFQRPFLGNEVWECIADESIDPGVRVRVESVEGSLVKIVKA